MDIVGRIVGPIVGPIVQPIVRPIVGTTFGCRIRPIEESRVEQRNEPIVRHQKLNLILDLKIGPELDYNET